MSCDAKANQKCFGSQVVSKGEKLYYEITAGEQTKLVTPDAVAKLVLEKMRGKIMSHKHVVLFLCSLCHSSR